MVADQCLMRSAKEITAPHLINLGRGIAEPDQST